MDFRTYIPIQKSDVLIGHNTRMMLFGSCFVENIGKLLVENKFRADVNPFGILYNPSSVAKAMERLFDDRPFSEAELVFRNGLFHSFWHHGDFSAPAKEECISSIRNRFSAAAQEINRTEVFLITFGTAYVYKLAANGEIAGNCHKFPDSTFTRSRLSAGQIANEWGALIARALSKNPGAKFVFTVSPIRHWKDGAHENQLSKSTLLISIDILQSQFPDAVRYFPAYEIVMDELRDYRFYAEDMTHPSEVAISYLWKRFGETYFSDETTKTVSEWVKIRKSLSHKPINPQGEEYRKFLSQTISSLRSFAAKHPHIHCETEIEHTTNLLETF